MEKNNESLPKLWNSNYVKTWFGNTMIFFSFMLVMPLLPIYMAEEFGAGKHTIGIVLSGYTVMAMIARMFSGYIVDTYNRKTVLILSFGIFATFFLGYLIGGSLILFAIIRTLHGAPFGTVTVSNSTVAIDVLNSKRRAEGIGYYGLSNNLATAISPTVGLFLYELTHSFRLIFILSFLSAALGVYIVSRIDSYDMPSSSKSEKSETKKSFFSLDRFFLVKGWSVGIMLACLSFSYGVLSTYLAIYSKEVLGMTGGTGMFFLILSLGLMVSRLTGSRSLRKGQVVRNATLGMSISVFSYLLFAGVHNPWGYYGCAVILGLGNGHMFPAVQTMFVNLAPNNRRGTANSSMLTSWDVGIGLGVVIGGIAAELINYNAAFWIAWIVNVIGVLFYFIYVKKSYLKNHLR